MRIAVTGATGFVGRHLVPTLMAQGHEVRGLVQYSSDTSGLSDAVELIRGDVRSLDPVHSLLEGCDSVVHLAASFSPADDVAGIIAAGTQNLLAAAREAGVKRLVYLSCLGADAAAEALLYAAKWQAEMFVRASELPHVILRPSLIVGRGDGVTQPLAGLIRSLPAIPVPGNGQYRQQPIDVEDLCRCVQVALREDALTDETVSVGGPMFVTYRQLVDLISGALDIQKPKVLIPPTLLPAVSWLLPASARELLQQPRLAQFQHGVVASPGIVQRMFGFQPRSIVPRLSEYLA